MDLSRGHESILEQERISDLMRIVPKSGSTILDVGARYGYISKKLTEHFDKVTAYPIQINW